MRAARWLIVSATTTALAAMLPPAVAMAGGPTTSVVLAMRPVSQSALDSLAHASGISPATRAQRLAAVTPGRSRIAAVSDAAGALGLRVAGRNAWTVRVNGPVALIAALFGAPQPAPDGTTHAFSRVPAALSRYVLAALPASGRVARPLDGLTGKDFRTDYATPASSSPGAGMTIATLQLSGWDSSDLLAYAQATGVADPVDNGHYVGISVDGADPTASDGQGGEVEVALDQEVLLSTAPAAKQRAYFVNNDGGAGGMIDALHQIGTDAARYNISALSTSWGECEYVDPTDPGPDEAYYQSIDNALEYAVAAGVTIFAATGDSGSMDCRGDDSVPRSLWNQPVVDYPGSSPYVVAVGGTETPGGSSTPAAWSGSGGGESTIETTPAYQSGVASQAGNGGRLVPDISSDAEPDPGFDVYADGQFQPVGGTSLSAPTQAALFVDTLSASGFTFGIGDIHRAIYAAAAANPATFTDITSGSNGAYTSGPGYDEVTGLGTPVWSSLVAWLAGVRVAVPVYSASRNVAIRVTPESPSGDAFTGWSTAVDRAAPCSVAAAHAPTTVAVPSDGRHTISVAGIDANGLCHLAAGAVTVDSKAPTVHAGLSPTAAGSTTALWQVTDAAPSTGLHSVTIRISSPSGTVWSAATTATSHTFASTAHQTYTLSVTAVDKAGNKTTTNAYIYDDRIVRYTGTWATAASSASYDKSTHTTSSSGRSATLTGTGKAYSVYVTTCPSCGELAIYSGGHYLTTIDTYASSTHHRVRFVVLSSTSGVKRNVIFTTVHKRNAHSTGYAVFLDAFTITA